MKYIVEIPDGPLCTEDCTFFIEETPEYQQFCTLVKKAFKGNVKLAECPAKPEMKWNKS